MSLPAAVWLPGDASQGPPLPQVPRSQSWPLSTPRSTCGPWAAALTETDGLSAGSWHAALGAARAQPAWAPAPALGNTGAPFTTHVPGVRRKQAVWGVVCLLKVRVPSTEGGVRGRPPSGCPKSLVPRGGCWAVDSDTAGTEACRDEARGGAYNPRSNHLVERRWG